MKYNFDRAQFYRHSAVINMGMREQKECYITINIHENKNIKTILHIKGKIYSSELFSPKKIFKIIKKEYENFAKSFSLEKVYIEIVKTILINIIQYSIELKELKIPYECFIKGLYLFDMFVENNKNLNK